MKQITLSKRLAAIADWVPTGARVADIGTDHGYIPVYLAQQGTAARLIASDIKAGPLQTARESAAEYGVSDQIEFVLAPGLEGVAPGSVDTVIIAGMGGETMEAILEAAPWVHAPGVTLLLQPQSKIDDLANWLDNSGYAICDAKLIRDAGRFYVLWKVCAGSSRAPFTCAEMYADRILLEKRDPLLPEYLDELISRTAYVLQGLRSAAKQDVLELTRQERVLEGLLKMREETKTWSL